MNKNGRGMNLVISLLLIVLLVFWFSGILRSMEDTCTQADSIRCWMPEKYREL